MRLTGIGNQTNLLDTIDGARLIVIRKITADADGAQDLTVRSANQDSAGYGNQPALRHAGECDEKCRRLFRTLRQSPAAHSHAQRSPRLALGNIRSENARVVLAFERHQVTARI